LTIDIHDIETRLWSAADELHAKPKLKSSECSGDGLLPGLGLLSRNTLADAALEFEGGEECQTRSFLK
jgi:hypothetical protein